MVNTLGENRKFCILTDAVTANVGMDIRHTVKANKKHIKRFIKTS
ncbi:hypothetical protein CRENPOLYSF2_4160003 [Crenothrix polyspora]|uniref:Uncharacterized protein n=1 Tax=Crenothrix polyspora TaxID=360316 RepID=A0A1R4HEH4_9GAMM|nr:hypothetical protein CRENPOLYSF2_4160003 [Crenothrix polyspora]